MNEHEQDNSSKPPTRDQTWHLNLLPVLLTGTGETAGLLTLCDMHTDYLCGLKVLEPGFDPAEAIDLFVEPHFLETRHAVLHSDDVDQFSVMLHAAAIACGHVIAEVGVDLPDRHWAWTQVMAYGEDGLDEPADLRGLYDTFWRPSRTRQIFSTPTSRPTKRPGPTQRPQTHQSNTRSTTGRRSVTVPSMMTRTTRRGRPLP